MFDRILPNRQRIAAASLLLIVAFLSFVYIRPTFGESPKPAPIYVFDVRALRQVDRSNIDDVRRVWDETLIVSALQGLVNRDEPVLYLLYISGFGHETDEFWLERFSQPIPNSDPIRKGWLQDRERRAVADLNEALEIFRDKYEGVVLYDEKVPATVNVALTICGVESLLPIRYDPTPNSLYDRLVASDAGLKLPVKTRLVEEDGSSLFTGEGEIPGIDLPSSGSAKTDAYYWMIENYVKTRRVDASEGGYYIDAFWIAHPNGAVQNHCLTNRDFVVARRGFFFDLSPWEDETPNDDLGQPLGADFKAFNAVMKAAYDALDGKGIVRVAGFTPWDTKYTDHGNCGGKHGGVPTEWRHAEILSSYNGYLDADALGLGAMANASFFQHFPLDDFYPQEKPTVEDLRARGLVDANDRPIDKTFVSIYVGDYDSAAWVYQSASAFWHDDARGSIPISWAFNPNLADRFAPGFDYFRRTKSDLDFFVSGDSGAGYVNPTCFEEPRLSGLPDGLDVWIEHCKKYFKQWDISGIGFLIDGSARTSDRNTLRRLSEYAPSGITTHRGSTMGVVPNPYDDKTPYRPMNFDLANPEQGKDVILGDVRNNLGSQFNTYRTILWSPAQLKSLYDMVKSDPDRGSRVEFVDAYTFWLLLKLEMNAVGKDEVKIRL